MGVVNDTSERRPHTSAPAKPYLEMPRIHKRVTINTNNNNSNSMNKSNNNNCNDSKT